MSARRCARPRTRRLAPAAIATACLAVTACGGGHAATKQDVIAQGNAICAGALRDIRALPAPVSAGASTAGLAKYLAHVVPIIQTEVVGLRKLPRPARDRALLNRFLVAMGTTEAQYRALLSAARSGNSAAVSEALSALADGPSAKLASQYGLTQCANASGTAVS
ncbi:MAG: hypothetical protein ACRDPM_25945 [Solirubrobacteraceae bacterium]